MDCHRWFLSLIFCGLLLAKAGGEQPAKQEFVCRFTTEPITIDGKPAEAAWQSAELIDHFYQPWQKDRAKARSSTRARLLWDREHFYFLAEMNDADLYADVEEHDGETWYNDVFELFFKPADDKPGYYEFQVNPAGTVLDMFLPRRGAGGYRRFARDGEFHVEAKVALRATLNQWQDRDEGWTVEGRIPWRDFVRTGGRPEVDETWKFTLCRYDYSVDFEGPELSTCAPLDSLPHPNFHHFEDYATLKFEGPDRVGGAGGKMHRLLAIKEALSRVPSTVAGSPDPPLPYRAVRVMPELKPSFPIYVMVEPLSGRLLLIDQLRPDGSTRICRTTEQPGELETLLEFPPGGVAYDVALHPHYADIGYLYVGWNGAGEGGEKRSIVTRHTVDRQKPYSLLKDSALAIIDWPSDGHNGAALAFGHDGMLYVTSGDGTSDSDTDVTGQGLDHLLSKLLRIDVDRPGDGRAYSVPPDNPFVGQAGVRAETWAYGFRNPWRITVDSQTGDVWVAQNGQDLWEQAYLIERGANYGWSVYEGSHLFYPNRRLGPTPVSKPTVEHPHSEARSLTGGVVYYGRKFPELRGAYIYGDYSTGKIWGVKVREGRAVWQRELADTTLQITCFAVDAEGELLISDHRGEGGLYTLEPNPVDPAARPFPRKLSETGLFTSVAGHQVHPGLLPYSVNAPLWSDGAHKDRYLYLPPAPPGDGSGEGAGQVAKFDFTSGDQGWNLPDGAIAVKSFALDTPQGRRWIETRLLVKQEGEWVGYSYRWNGEQTEAELVDAPGLDQSFDALAGDGGVRSQSWHYPSRAECMVCHSRAANYLLGLSTPQFNKTHDYGPVQANQLEVLEWLGALRVNWMAEQHAALREELKQAGKSDQEADDDLRRLTATRNQRQPKTSSLLFKRGEQYPALVDPYDPQADLTLRVRSYLHANCAQCHVEAGGGNAQMQLAWSTPLDKMKLINVPPVHHTFDLAEPRLVAPGDPSRSVLLHRISIRDRGQMPQLATSVVDEQAVQLFREWIQGLKE
ncbi:MAG: PQQ-dependent sugar dehydrogenase [Pirellulales bacterium]